MLELALADDEEDAPQPLYEPEDKVIAKVATLYGILEQLGFAPPRIEQCIREVKVLELEDCLDWLFLHADADELACEGPLAPPELVPESAPPTPRPGNSPKGSSTRVPTTTTTLRSSPASPALAAAAASSVATASDEASESASLRARILAYGDELDRALESATAASDSGGSGDGAELPDANVKYAKLKVQLSEVQRALQAHKRVTKGKGDRKGAQALTEEQETWFEAQSELLKDKVKAVEGDYTFRKVDAEKLYREERTKLDAAQLSARLSGTTLESPFPGLPATPRAPSSAEGLAPSAEIATPASTSSPAGTPATTATTNGTSASASSPPSPAKASAAGGDDGLSASGDGDGGDFFGNMLDEMPAEETTESGTTVPVRNMALPKHFSGKTPKVSLEETVRKLDKYATVVFTVLSRSRAVRAGVTIRWSADGGKTQSFAMDDVACWDQRQAYDYVATVALFAVAMGEKGSGMAVNKALPTVFRDLWDELVAKRRAEDEDGYRAKLQLYRSLAAPRVQDAPSKVRLAFLSRRLSQRALTGITLHVRAGRPRGQGREGGRRVERHRRAQGDYAGRRRADPDGHLHAPGVDLVPGHARASWSALHAPPRGSSR